MKRLVVLVLLLTMLSSPSASSAAATAHLYLKITWNRNGHTLGKRVTSPKAANGFHLIWRVVPGAAAPQALAVFTKKGQLSGRPSVSRASEFDFECWWSYPPLDWGCRWSSSSAARVAFRSVSVPRGTDGMQLFVYGTSFTEAFWTRGGAKFVQLKRIALPPGGQAPNAVNLNSSKSNTP